jgi:hypothetical protein
MPNIGDTASGRSIGLSSSRYIWTQCPDCGTERWVQYKTHDPAAVRRCQQCQIKYARERFKNRKAKRDPSL